MIDIETIERYVDQVLEVNGFCKGDKELLRQLLHRLYTAASIFHLMTDEQRASHTDRAQCFFCDQNRVKREKKEGKEKKHSPHTPYKRK